MIKKANYERRQTMKKILIIELKDMNNSKSIKINLDNTNEIVDIIKNKH